MAELARGLVASEYWTLIREVLVGDLESAKASLEDTSIGVERFRVMQGKVAALLAFHGMIGTLSRYGEEKEDGEESS